MDQRHQHHDCLAPLSKRERMVAERFAEGLTHRQIGNELFIAPTTVRTHIAAIYRKLGIGNKAALVRLWSERQNNLSPAFQIEPRPGLIPVPTRVDHLMPGWRPTIAVLPFANRSGGDRWTRLADGITGDILTNLTRYGDLTVIAGASSFPFRGRDVDARETGGQLGVRYILEGSIQAAGGWMRLTAQLIDAQTGAHLWAERYDREEDDLFLAQHDIVQQVAGAMRVREGHMRRAEQGRRSARSSRWPASATFDALLEGARTQFLAIGGKRMAYRSVGKGGPGGVPLVVLPRCRGSMDDWDPALINAVARDRRVILFDNFGIGESDGRTPESLEQMADDAASFILALGLREVDVLGWSMGGMIAQILAVRHADLVRRLALLATLPPGVWGGSLELVAQVDWEKVAHKPTYTDEDLLSLFFSPSPESVAAGLASIERTSFRRKACEIKTRPESMHAQGQAAMSFFRNEGDWYGKLGSIQAPALVASGDKDPHFPTINSVVLAREMPQSQLAIYPDASHSFHFQYPDRFATDLRAFLRR